METIPKNILDLIVPGRVVIFSKTYCSFCTTAKSTFKKMGVKYTVVECDVEEFTDNHLKDLINASGIKTYPKIFVGKRSIGGFDSLQDSINNNTLFTYLDEEKIPYTQKKSNF